MSSIRRGRIILFTIQPFFANDRNSTQYMKAWVRWNKICRFHSDLSASSILLDRLRLYNLLFVLSCYSSSGIISVASRSSNRQFLNDRFLLRFSLWSLCLDLLRLFSDQFVIDFSVNWFWSGLSSEISYIILWWFICPNFADLSEAWATTLWFLDIIDLIATTLSCPTLWTWGF